MKIYLLWFVEWEDRHCLGIFETKTEAENYRKYFIKYPVDQEYGPDLEHFSGRADFKSRFRIEEKEVGSPCFPVDNLKYLEMMEEKCTENS
jgi:hypothetical protein